MKSWVFGYSRLNLPIIAWSFGNEGPQVLILGGVHGDEAEGVAAAQGLLAEFMKSFNYKLQVTLIPIFNPDGVLQHDRVNGAGIDLNRNMPTKDWSPKIAKPRYNPGKQAGSEPENQALIKFIESRKLELIISLHSYDPMININGDCRPEAEIIAKHTGYKITEDMGYPTPGSLGTYGGQEGRVPVITYEVQRGLGLDEVIAKHRQPILEALKYTEANR